MATPRTNRRGLAAQLEPAFSARTIAAAGLCGGLSKVRALMKLGAQRRGLGSRRGGLWPQFFVSRTRCVPLHALQAHLQYVSRLRGVPAPEVCFIPYSARLDEVKESKGLRMGALPSVQEREARGQKGASGGPSDGRQPGWRGGDRAGARRRAEVIMNHYTVCS